MIEQMRKLIHQLQKVWNKIMADGRRRVVVMLIPFVLALIGYLMYYEGSVLFAVSSALKVYAGGFDASFGDVKLTAGDFGSKKLLMRICLECARWMGLYITGTFLFRFIREQFERAGVARKAHQEDAIAVHGSAHYEALLGDLLGKQAITKDIPEKFDAKRHVLAFESDADMMKYLSEHFMQFERGKDKQVYLCVCSASHMKYSREGFIINNMAENCARLYWKRHYIRRHERKMERRIALIGFGCYGQMLLSQALMVNVFTQGTPGMEYHVFGDSAAYRHLHRGIGHFAAINEENSNGDSVFFHEGGWESQLDLLAQMDRVILCSDADEENIRVLSVLEAELTNTVIHIRSKDARLLKALYSQHRLEEDDPDARLNVFGTDRVLYTREMILHEELLDVAKRIHARYMCTECHEACRTCATRGKTTPCVNGCAYFYREWNKLGLFLQRSNIYAADHMEVKMREMIKRDCSLTGEALEQYMDRLKACCQKEEMTLYQELEHRRWMRSYFFNGWTYADIPGKDAVTKRHPMLKPYDELSERIQKKDMDAYMVLCDLQQEIKPSR